MGDQQHGVSRLHMRWWQRGGCLRGCLVWTTLPALTLLGLFVVGPSTLLRTFYETYAEYAAVSAIAQVVVVPSGPSERYRDGNTVRSGASRIAIRRLPDNDTARSFPATLVHRLVISPDDQFVAVTGADFVLRLYRLRDGALVHTFPEHVDDDRQHVMFSPDGQLLLARSTDQHLLTWQVADGWLLRRFPLQRGAGRMALSPDGRLIAIDTVDDGVLLLRAEDGSMVHQLADRGVNNLTFSPDGRYLALGLGPVRPTRPGDTGVRGAVHLWRLDVPNPYREHALASADFVYAVAFSPDGQYLAAAGSRATLPTFGLDFTWQALLPAARQIAIWRVTDGQPLQTIRTSHATIYGLTFGPDGQTLIAQGFGADPNQGIITVWRVAPRWGWLDWLLPLSVVVAVVGWCVGLWRARVSG